jgi:hypothetical protein
MAKHILAKGIPEDEVDAVEQAFLDLGATDVTKTEETVVAGAEKTFTLEGTFDS